MEQITPTECFGQVADILTKVVGSPYRKEPMTETELDAFVDRVMLWAQSQKEKKDGNDKSRR